MVFEHHDRKPYEFIWFPELVKFTGFRFLSRTCGTMQLALATFDPSGDGKFTREEWAQGLKKLEWEATCDVQEPGTETKGIL